MCNIFPFVAFELCNTWFRLQWTIKDYKDKRKFCCCSVIVILSRDYPMKDKNGYLKRKESTNHHLHFTSLYFFFLPEEMFSTWTCWWETWSSNLNSSLPNKRVAFIIFHDHLDVEFSTLIFLNHWNFLYEIWSTKTNHKTKVNIELTYRFSYKTNLSSSPKVFEKFSNLLNGLYNFFVDPEVPGWIAELPSVP